MCRQGHLISDPIVFQAGHIGHITTPSRLSAPSSEQLGPTRCICLPTRQEAHILVDFHINTRAPLFPYVHGPSLRRAVEEVYDALASRRPVHLGKASLLLAICSNVTQGSVPGDLVSELFSGTADKSRSRSWIKATMDVIDTVEREGWLSLESLQSMLTTLYVIRECECSSPRCRGLLYRAIAMARELSLHRIDDPSIPDKPESVRGSLVLAEVARRVWWNLVVIDWQANHATPNLTAGFANAG